MPAGKAPMYRLYHVPVAPSTDDEGVSRINLTHEYVRAALANPLTYSDCPATVFGSSPAHGKPTPTRLPLPAGPRSGLGSMRIAAHGEKARQQFEPERRFRAFETAF